MSGRMYGRLLIAAALLGGGAAAAWYFNPFSPAKSEAAYRMAKLDRGDIVAEVSSSGTINPISTVIVGSQLSGQVVEILSDYNDIVTAGQVMARLNTDQLRAKLDAARADLAQARALAQVQEATLQKNLADQMKARATLQDMAAQQRKAEALVDDAKKTLDRQKQLITRGAATEVTLQAAETAMATQAAARDSAIAQISSAQAALDSLIADGKVTEGQLASARASVSQREAVIRQIQVDIRNSEITSPVNGVVVQRNVELGQTVAASLQAPTLFLVAENLDNMVIYANVDESDVGRIKPDQPAPFTVNAFPGRTFQGHVQQVRLGSQTIQNVVIYTAVIAVENPGRILLPGMTANVRILTEQKNGVLRLPNAALRWRPPSEAAAARPGAGAPQTASPLGGPPPQLGGGPQAGGDRANSGRQFREFADRVKKELQLDEAQSASVDAIFEGARQRVREIATAGGSPAQRRDNFARFRRDIAEQVKAVLNAEQNTKFETLAAEFAPGGSNANSGRVHRLGANGDVETLTVRLGVTDGAFTEVVRAGSLKEGDEIIIGGGPRASTPASPPPGGPRPGF